MNRSFPSTRKQWMTTNWLPLVGLVTATLPYACTSRQREGELIAHGSEKDTVAANAPVSENNAIATSEAIRARSKESKGISPCITLSLHVMDTSEGRDIQGTVEILNRCATPASILTAPLEVQVRLNPGDFFVPETLVEPLYARVYITRKEAGLGVNAYLGDGGVEVLAWPSQVLVGAHARRELRIAGRAAETSKLPPGEYEAVLVTLAAPGLGQEGGTSFFDLSQSVQQYNSTMTQAGHLVRRAGAVEVSSPAASFRVVGTS
jgi:hypothetical protein